MDFDAKAALELCEEVDAQIGRHFWNTTKLPTLTSHLRAAVGEIERLTTRCHELNEQRRQAETECTRQRGLAEDFRRAASRGSAGGGIFLD